MAVPTRHINAPGTYFVTSRTWESQALLFNERNVQALIETLMDYKAAGKYELHAFVVMPEHIHVLLTPALESSLERTVQLIKGGSSHRIGLLTPRRFPFWQRGFSDHRIRARALHRTESGEARPGAGCRGVSLFFGACGICTRPNTSVAKAASPSRRGRHG
jgi:putative transposase